MPNLYDKNHLYKEFIDVTTKKFDEPFSCLGTASFCFSQIVTAIKNADQDILEFHYREFLKETENRELDYSKESKKKAVEQFNKLVDSIAAKLEPIFNKNDSNRLVAKDEKDEILTKMDCKIVLSQLEDAGFYVLKTHKEVQRMTYKINGISNLENTALEQQSHDKDVSEWFVLMTPNDISTNFEADSIEKLNAQMSRDQKYLKPWAEMYQKHQPKKAKK